MQMLNCEGRPYWGTTTSYVEPNSDHLGNVCDGVKPNRGTEYDWLRLLWDLDSQGLSTSQILEVWDWANSNSWRATDAGTAGRPWERILVAAGLVGVLSEFSTLGAQNGTDQL